MKLEVIQTIMLAFLSVFGLIFGKPHLSFKPMGGQFPWQQLMDRLKASIAKKHPVNFHSVPQPVSIDMSPPFLNKLTYCFTQEVEAWMLG